MRCRSIEIADSAAGRIAMAAALLIAGAVMFTLSARGAESGHYTAAQAEAGHGVYAAHCAVCHGARLQGGPGPALIGAKFARSLESDPITGPQLYEFITSHMPAGEPGSLGDREFLQAFAYLLAANGYPAGDAPLTKRTLGETKLLPYPGPRRDAP